MRPCPAGASWDCHQAKLASCLEFRLQAAPRNSPRTLPGGGTPTGGSIKVRPCPARGQDLSRLSAESTVKVPLNPVGREQAKTLCFRVGLRFSGKLQTDSRTM